MIPSPESRRPSAIRIDGFRMRARRARGVRRWENSRIRETSGAFRIIYIATLPEAVYVLQALQKKTEKTDKRDIDLAADRLRALLKER
jgi:phage-related protein